jgi:antitoxin component of MazEF toxin-antitoxin module
MQTHIIQIGNSLGLRLPKGMLDSLQLGRASAVEIEASAGAIVLRPAHGPRAGWDDAFAATPAAPESLWGDLAVGEGWDR